jgi:hypothetical protein
MMRMGRRPKYLHGSGHRVELYDGRVRWHRTAAASEPQPMATFRGWQAEFVLHRGTAEKGRRRENWLLTRQPGGEVAALPMVAPATHWTRKQLRRGIHGTLLGEPFTLTGRRRWRPGRRYAEFTGPGGTFRIEGGFFGRRTLLRDGEVLEQGRPRHWRGKQLGERELAALALFFFANLEDLLFGSPFDPVDTASDVIDILLEGLGQLLTGIFDGI